MRNIHHTRDRFDLAVPSPLSGGRELAVDDGGRLSVISLEKTTGPEKDPQATALHIAIPIKMTEWKVHTVCNTKLTTQADVFCCTA